MSRIHRLELSDFLIAWMGDPQLPLEVSRAHYDEPQPHSWEVLANETPTFSVPIAEFTEWAEAQRWAYAMSLWAAENGAQLRRYKYGHWPSGQWGGIGYFDQAGDYHELPDPEVDWTS